MNLSLAIKERALALGFDLAGIAPLAVWKDLEFSRQWVEQGYGGEMRYLKNPTRHDARLILPSVRSVVCVGLVYNTTLPYSSQVSTDGGIPPPTRGRAASEQPSAAEPRGWISRYAWGQDYHAVMRAKLEQLRAVVEELVPAIETRVFVDTGPIVERAFTRYSGIGWMGKNTCLINEAKGSWFFIGVMLTTLDLEPDLPAPDRCGSCTACLEACPTGALVEPYVMDASRCISYFTIELKGNIPAGFRSAIGANLFGCDICQDVCPWNSPRRAAVTHQPEFQPRHVDLVGEGLYGPPAGSARANGAPAFSPPETTDAQDFSLFNPPLQTLASLSEDDFRRVFSHSPVKRVKYPGWLRNLCVAMGNSGDLRFVRWLERAREHPDPVVREHAEWALERLRNL